MRFRSNAGAACMIWAAYAVSPAQAQVTQTSPQPNSPSATESAPSGASSAAPFFAGGSPLAPGWSFNVAPYGWLASVKATINTPTRSGGVATTDVYVPFGDLIRDLRFVGMLAGEARYDRFSVVTDFMYMNLGIGLSAAHLSSVGPNNIPKSSQLNISTGLGTTVWTLAGGYTLSAGGWGNIDAIAGTRLLAVDATTSYTLDSSVQGLGKSGSLGVNVDKWDAIVGARGRIDIPNSSFFVPFYVDVGTGDLPLTWQAFTGVGYHTSLADYSIGYRYLAFEASGNSTVKNLAMGGVMMAASFHF